jgi:26S proteasome regulatory subunit N3
MPGKTPQRNGNEPIENGIRNNKDVEMTDEKSSLKGKTKKGAKEGEDMTVVVPPSKNSKQTPPADADGDVAMDVDDSQDLGVKVDPVTQAITGTSLVCALDTSLPHKLCSAMEALLSAFVTCCC